MTTPSLVILYVASPAASAEFYAGLLGQAPDEASPGFAMFRLPGFGLGLWARDAVLPAAPGSGGGGEIVFMVADVDAVFAEWSARGVAMAQAPADAEFGRSFVAHDPDGNRLRVMRPS